MISFVEQTIGRIQYPVVLVDDASIKAARTMRTRRDSHYGNIYQEAVGDERWVGDLGEIVLDHWLTVKNIPHLWLAGDNAAGKHDFEISGVKVGAKAVKRKVPMRPNFTAQITARHADEPIDQFFFMCFEFPRKAMWLLGGITKQDFLRDARHYGAGERVHQNYVVREGHEIFNIEIRHLQSPNAWVSSLGKI